VHGQTLFVRATLRLLPCTSFNQILNASFTYFLFTFMWSDFAVLFIKLLGKDREFLHLLDPRKRLIDLVQFP